MKSVFAVVFCFQIVRVCSVDFTASSSTVVFTDEGVSGDDISTESQGEANGGDRAKSKFNESEIFEHGQTEKEIHQRSFIYIHNAKSRLPWKINASGSSFLVDDFINNSFKNADGSSEHSKNDTKQNLPNPKQNLPNRSNYDFKIYPFSFIYNRRNIMGVTKQPSASCNERTLPPPTFASMKSYYRKLNEVIPAMKPKAQNMYSHKEYPNAIGRNYKMFQAVTGLVTPHPPTFPFILKKDNSQKLNQLINDIANDNIFNCFSLDCLPISNTYRVNNGIKRGSKCECQNSRSANKRAQLWRARKIPVNTSEKFIRSITANVSDAFYDQIIQEAKKLTKAVEAME